MPALHHRLSLCYLHGYALSENSNGSTMVCLCDDCSSFITHFLSRKGRQKLLHNTANVCFVYDVYRSFEFSLSAISHAHWKCSGRPKLKVFDCLRRFKTNKNRFLGDNVNSVDDLLVLNFCRCNSHSDGGRFRCNLLATQKKE